MAGKIGGSNRKLSLKEAAGYVGINAKTFANMYREWNVPHMKIGKAVIFTERELDGWFESWRRA